MRELVSAYKQRRHIELGQMGAVVAAATNEPKKLAETLDTLVPQDAEMESDDTPTDFVKRWWDPDAVGDAEGDTE